MTTQPSRLTFDIGGAKVDVAKQIMLLERSEMEDSLYLFLKHAWRYIDSSAFTEGWPLEAMAEHLQAVADGDIKRLIINIPPRCGKSSLISVAFPAWVWAQPWNGPTSGPGVQFLSASYAQQLSLRDSVKCRRLIESPWYQELWGDRFKLVSDQNTKTRFDNDKSGSRLSTSVGSALTGEGGNCCVAGTRVLTPTGYMAIEFLAVDDSVLAFDISRGEVVWSRVMATAARDSDDIYEIRTAAGNRLKCTGDHPVFTQGRGYVPARDLGPGDRLLVESGTFGDLKSDLRRLRGGDNEATLRGQESAVSGQSGQLLLQEVLLSASRDQEHEEVSDLRESRSGPASDVLFGSLRGGGAACETDQRDLPTLRDGIRRDDNVLLRRLRGRGAFRADDRVGKLELHGTGGVLESVQGDVEDCSGEGQFSMRGLPGEGQARSARQRVQDFARDASHRRGYEEQHAGEPDHSLSVMPWETSWWDVVHVARVAGDRRIQVSVHDIQVEGCCNFFAEGILVHNCIIIDDPNAAQEAYSEASIAATIDWWDTALSTRLNDPKTGAFVLIQQRLSEEDLTGHILSKDAGSWTHLCLPARYEWDRHSSTSIGWNDPRGCDEDGNSLVVIDENGNRLARDAEAAGELSRREGLLLWPERMGEREISILEKQLGPDAAAGQLQQRPSPKGGGIIKDAWWQVWDANVFPEMSYIIAALDTAYTIKTSNDFSALTVWGVFTGDAASTVSRYTNRDGRMTLQEEQAEKFDQGTKIRLMRDFSGESFPKVMLMSAWQERAELHDLVSKVAKTCKDLKVDLLLVENKAAGHSVAQEIQRLYDREGFGVLLTDPGAQDKLARLYSVQHIFAEQMVYAPSKSWAEMVIRQVSQFPKGKHDDLVDTVSAGISYLRKAGLLTRGPEWAESMESGMMHTGKPLAPLYEV